MGCYIRGEALVSRRAVREGMHSRIVAGATLALLAGCPSTPDPEPPRRTERVRVRSFTEASAVRQLLVASPYVFSAGDTGLDRWSLRTGEVLHITAEHGLPGERVEAMAHDASRGWLWLATDAGVGRYDLATTTFTTIPPPPSVLGLESFAAVALEPSSDGGLWIGHDSGLYYANTAGQWTNTGVTDPVTSIYAARDGWLWIGTGLGLIGRQPDGESFRYGVADGCDLQSVRFIVRAPDGGPLVVGENGAGKQRVVLVLDGNCASYRAAPEARWDAATSGLDEVIVLAGDALYSLRMPTSGARRLRRDGMRLVPVPGVGVAPRSPYVMRTLDLPLPPGIETIASVEDEILIGTRDLGVARLIAGKRRGRNTWLRRSELVDGARSLSVACAAPDDCYLATGAETWRFDGERFVPIEAAGDILAVVRSDAGVIYAVHRTENDQRIALSVIRLGVLELVTDLEIETPGGRPELTFNMFSPSGVLWLGLRYRDEVGELRPYGVALVDITLGAVVYHHATADIREVREGVLPIPINAVDVTFIGNEDEIWMATTEGAAALRGPRVEVFTEAEGLRSEVLRTIAASSGGVVFVGSHLGVEIYDGSGWKHPRLLRYPVNDMAIGPDGRLWMATDRGLVVYDGASVRRLDRRRGLVQNEVEDLAIDHLGRIWVRGSQGLTLVTL
jgi:hypothetical protein